MSQYVWHATNSTLNHNHPASPPPTPTSRKYPAPNFTPPLSQQSATPSAQPLWHPHSDITVTELSEDDLGYASDIEVLHPDEFEEVDSASEASGAEDNDKDDPNTAIARRLSHLRCRELPSSEAQSQKRLEKQVRSGKLKRTHSEIMATDSEEDTEQVLDDQDVVAGARRLRRRTRGPSEHSSLSLEEYYSERAQSPAKLYSSRANDLDTTTSGVAAGHGDEMEIDAYNDSAPSL